MTRGSDQEAILDYVHSFFKDAPGVDDVLVITRSNDLTSGSRLVQATILKTQGKDGWELRDPHSETYVRSVHLGDELTVQWVSKYNTSIGAEFSHSHPQAQVTLVLEGQCTVKIGGQTVDLGAGDMVFVPAGVRHTFIDRSEVIRVADLIYPRRKEAPPDL